MLVLCQRTTRKAWLRAGGIGYCGAEEEGYQEECGNLNNTGHLFLPVFKRKLLCGNGYKMLIRF
jgi:hypothetical protein